MGRKTYELLKDATALKLRGQALQGARFLWGWSLGTHPAR